MRIVSLRYSILGCAAVVGLWGATVLPAQAVEGTCSWHGGVNCSAGADWDASPVCNDGWRNSSELYFQMKECAGYTLKTPCTEEEYYAIKAKHNIGELENKNKELTAESQAVLQEALSVLKSTGDERQKNESTRLLAIKSLSLQSALAPIRAELQNEHDAIDRECQALGAVEYQKRQQDFLNSLHKMDNQTQNTPQPTCNANATLSGDKCICNTGYYQYSSRCYTNEEFCPLALGAGGIAVDAANCTCKTGYTLDYVKKYCVSTPVIAAAPTVTTAPKANIPTKQELPIAKIKKVETRPDAVTSLAMVTTTPKATTTLQATTSAIQKTLQTPRISTFWQKLTSPFKTFWGKIFR